MDIFTTQLTRVVQTPIKKANLKVKALRKEAGANKLKEDHDHLENHDYYFEHSVENNRTDLDEESEKSTKEAALTQSPSEDDFLESKRIKKIKNEDENVLEDDVPKPHLDIFV